MEFLRFGIGQKMFSGSSQLPARALFNKEEMGNGSSDFHKRPEEDERQNMEVDKVVPVAAGVKTQLGSRSAGD